ncbi:MAG: hypothetical protein BAJALOKI1v1_880007 [Promethearchaeota archaeon]|nr:MAG: hypothetical protein BAJALOKI1v1_880007 [Candidatus Lokiarchaeota archaeon]
MTDLEKYILFQKGTLPLIVSIPHGGTVKLEDIPRRENGVTGIDKGTIELGKDLITNLEQKIHKKQGITEHIYYIISKIHRSRIDLNRPAKEAYHPEAILGCKLYHLYHNKLQEYVVESIKIYGTALLLDIHGFESYKRPKGFRDVDIILGTNNLRSLFDYPIRKKDWNKNIRGRLIKNLLKLEIPIAPARSRREEYVLKGGYITQKYGAAEIKNSKSLQVEFSERIRIKNKDMRNKVLKIFIKVLYKELFENP